MVVSCFATRLEIYQSPMRNMASLMLQKSCFKMKPPLVFSLFIQIAHDDFIIIPAIVYTK